MSALAHCGNCGHAYHAGRCWELIMANLKVRRTALCPCRKRQQPKEEHDGLTDSSRHRTNRDDVLGLLHGVEAGRLGPAPRGGSNAAGSMYDPIWRMLQDMVKADIAGKRRMEER